MSGRSRGLGAKMAGGNPDPTRGREVDDFYATPTAVTRALFYAHEDSLRGARIYEPCAGDGAMMDEFMRCGAGSVQGADINPRRADIAKRDVMDLSLSTMPECDAIITNPPFFLAPQIIERVMGMSEERRPKFFALVLKATFWHARGRFKLFEQFRPTDVHPLLWRPDFKGLGNPTMDIIWCVWNAEHADIGETLYTPIKHPGEPV